MLTVPPENLDRVLNKSFPDGSKRAVPIFGAGLNLQAFYGQGQGALDWEGLLSEVTSACGIALSNHPSMTARWEAMVQECAHVGDVQAGVAEQILRDKVCEVLRRHSQAGPQETHRRVMQCSFRDIITLNFGTLLSQSAETSRLGLANNKVRSGQQQNLQPDTEETKLRTRVSHRHRQRYICEQGTDSTSRIWHPHGTVDTPETIVLGTRDYGVYIEALRGAFGHFKGDEQQFLQERALPANPHNADTLYQWEEVRRGCSRADNAAPTAYQHEPASWMELLMLSDLVFVGCGLGQDEFPLWWVLHQRARNFARYNNDDRPKTYYLTTKQQANNRELLHLTDAPAGIEVIAFDDHPSMWSALLDAS